MKSFAFALAGVLFASQTYAQEEPLTNTGRIEFDMEMRGVTSMLDTSSRLTTVVPLPYRQVPGHKNDFGSVPPLITIPDSTVGSLKFEPTFGLSIAPELVFFHRFRVRAGVEIGFVAGDDARQDSTGNTREINLGGTTARGYGESLVYYAVAGDTSFQIHPYYEAEVKIAGPIWVLVGHQTIKNTYRLVRGWDRYDKLEEWKSQDLAEAKLIDNYIGFRYRVDAYPSIAFTLTVGKTRGAITNLIPDGPVMSMSSGYSFGFTIGGSTF